MGIFVEAIKPSAGFVGGGGGDAGLHSISLSGAGVIEFYTGGQKYATHGAKTVYILRHSGTSGAASVDYTLYNGINGNASAQSGTLSWSAGQKGPQSISITTASAGNDGPSYFHLELSNVSGATLACRHYFIAIYPSTNNVPEDSRAIFVSPSGNDSTGTGAVAAPYKTVTKAQEDLSTSKQIIVMRGGTYNMDDERAETAVGVGCRTISLLGTSTGLSDSWAHAVLIMKYPGETPALDGAASTNSSVHFGMYASDSDVETGSGDYHIIYGIEMQNGDAPIRIYGSTNNMIVHHCHLHDCDGGAGSNVGGVFIEDSSDIIVAHNRIHDLTVGGGPNNNTGGILCYRPTRIMFSNNIVYDINHVIHFKESHATASTWHGSCHANLCYSPAGSGDNQGVYWSNDNNSGLSKEQKNNSTIGNLVSWGNTYSLPYGSSDTSEVKGVCIEHNTFVATTYPIALYGTASNSTGPVVLSNVLVGSDAGILLGKSGDDVLLCDYNFYELSSGNVWERPVYGTTYAALSNVQTTFGAEQEANGVEGNVIFTDDVSAAFEDRDYTLTSSSIGHTSVSTTIDGANAGAYYLINPGII